MLENFKMTVQIWQIVLHDLEEDTANAPDVHLQAVVSVGEEALWSSVPAGGDVLCVRRLGVHTPTGAKVPELQDVMLQVEQEFIKLWLKIHTVWYL